MSVHGPLYMVGFAGDVALRAEFPCSLAGPRFFGISVEEFVAALVVDLGGYMFTSLGSFCDSGGSCLLVVARWTSRKQRLLFSGHHVAHFAFWERPRWYSTHRLHGVWCVRALPCGFDYEQFPLCLC